MVDAILYEMFCKSNIKTDISNVDLDDAKNILENLSKNNINYTWEVVKDVHIDETQSAIDVRVYCPGAVLYGRYVYSTTTIKQNAHLYAICNAFKMLRTSEVKTETEEPKQIETPKQVEQPKIEEPKVKTEALSQEEILNMVVQQNEQPVQEENHITTAKQMREDNREEIPFGEMDLDTNELDKLIGSNHGEPVNKNNGQMGFTPEQIQGIKDFKQKFSIMSDDVLGNYINSWDNKYSKKEDLTPSNINSFLAWTETLGKAQC